MDIQAVLDAFGVAALAPPRSLYAYAPVFRVRDAAGDWVVKRTGLVNASGQAVADWVRALHEEGVAVVTPAGHVGRNPRVLTDGHTWVMYPFVPGAPYAGTLREVRAAGELLGRIHASRAPEGGALKTIPGVVTRDAAWTDRHAGAARAAMTAHAPALADTFERRYAALRDAYEREVRPRVSGAELPLAGASMDFKASNLVFRSPTAPVLVDPDHAAFAPRAYDLAVAALLFHSDLPGPPRTVWTHREWLAFLMGYGLHVRWTSRERELWPDVLLCAWLDQAVWLLGNFEAGWADEGERTFLSSLALTDLGCYALPGQDAAPDLS